VKRDDLGHGQLCGARDLFEVFAVVVHTNHVRRGCELVGSIGAGEGGLGSCDVGGLERAVDRDAHLRDDDVRDVRHAAQTREQSTRIRARR